MIQFKLAALTVAALLFAISSGRGQLIDSFSDDNFNSNPKWTGTTDHWQIVTNSDVAGGASNSYTLRLNAAAASGTEYLSTQRTESWGVGQTWGFWLGRRAQTATTQNASYVWLWASEANLTSGTVDGYRIRFGENGDDKLHFEKVVHGVMTGIVSSTDKVTSGLKNIGFLVRVTRSAGSEWKIYTSVLPSVDNAGAKATEIPSAANTPVWQATVMDYEFTNFNNGYFGFMAKHTKSDGAPTGAEFDQLYFAPEFDHPIPVELISFQATASGNTVALTWVTASETENAGFYIFRSDKKEGPYLQINQSLIRGAGNSESRQKYIYIDESVQPGKTYYYKLVDVNFKGVLRYHDPIKVTISAKPEEIVLRQNYPNPFNPQTAIEFLLPVREVVELSVYNVQGRLVKTLFAGEASYGIHQVIWHGLDKTGKPVPSGSYFYRLKTQNVIVQKKLTLTR